ncbi:MAG: YcaQ family DNA glycosylase [Planctomycetes bacterium]|nr:YcaQ family DNA glycosylase [Planctomycetota bacterium]MCB9890669.1 YcaQ family DNA glycosylase [Planctomycetota bacterium]MCB9920108.1 YcaQ family DNA glycosylase [Planctomycetota bacterium]
MTELSIAEARRLAIAAQGLDKPKRSIRIDGRHLRRAMEKLELLQLDSVSAVVRSHYMPHFSRLGTYDMEKLDQLAYRDGSWFEAWSHEASLLPVDSEPLLRWHKARCQRGATWQGLVSFAKREDSYIRSVLSEVEARGPLRSGELSEPRRRKGSWWDSRSMGTLALDWLYRVGALAVRRDSTFGRTYDLYERVIPEHVRTRATPHETEALEELLVRAARALGVGFAEDLVDYFRLPKVDAKKLLDGLVEDGRLIATTIEGHRKPAFRHPEARLPRRVDAAALLSPFDPMVWNRTRTERLFDFCYRIEIYVPAPKRQYGYYVYPFLVGDRLVARFDLLSSRRDRVLHVKGSYAEAGVDHDLVATRAHEELRRLAQFVGASELRVGSKGNLARSLRAIAKRGA